MACGTGTLQLSPTNRKVLASIKDEYLSIDQIATKTKLPLFKVRSSIRLLKRNNLAVEKDATFKAKNDNI